MVSWIMQSFSDLVAEVLEVDSRIVDLREGPTGRHIYPLKYLIDLNSIFMWAGTRSQNDLATVSFPWAFIHACSLQGEAMS